MTNSAWPTQVWDLLECSLRGAPRDFGCREFVARRNEGMLVFGYLLMLTES
jgi:hypothetical protein